MCLTPRVWCLILHNLPWQLIAYEWWFTYSSIIQVQSAIYTLTKKARISWLHNLFIIGVQFVVEPAETLGYVLCIVVQYTVLMWCAENYCYVCWLFSRIQMGFYTWGTHTTNTQPSTHQFIRKQFQFATVDRGASPHRKKQKKQKQNRRSKNANSSNLDRSSLISHACRRCPRYYIWPTSYHIGVYWFQ